MGQQSAVAADILVPPDDVRPIVHFTGAVGARF